MPQPTLHPLDRPDDPTDDHSDDNTDDHTDDHTEEHELPSIEAVLAGTLALMTGYSQALQAELDPEHRLRMGVRIGDNLALLMDHPMLSLGFRQVICGLRDRWQAMSDCTAQAARDCAGTGVATKLAGVDTTGRFLVPAPKCLQ